VTAEQRDEVVELLRCAADLCSTRSDSALSMAGERLGYTYCDAEYKAAWSARRWVLGERVEYWYLNSEIYLAALLEAARRVEEGWNP